MTDFDNDELVAKKLAKFREARKQVVGRDGSDRLHGLLMGQVDAMMAAGDRKMVEALLGMKTLAAISANMEASIRAGLVTTALDVLKIVKGVHAMLTVEAKMIAVRRCDGIGPEEGAKDEYSAEWRAKVEAEFQRTCKRGGGGE